MEDRVVPTVHINVSCSSPPNLPKQNVLIVIISGKKGSGKNSAARMLRKVFEEDAEVNCTDLQTQQTAFANPLKRWVAFVGNTDISKFNDDKGKGKEDIPFIPKEFTKEQLFRSAIYQEFSRVLLHDHHPDDANKMFRDMYAKTLDLFKHNLTWGKILQQVGTDVVKEIDKDFWIKLSCLKIFGCVELYKDNPSISTRRDLPFQRVCFFTDGRFEEEADFGKKNNGVVIRINRPLSYNSSDSRDKNHRSETALDDYEHFDEVIENNGTKQDLARKLRLMVSNKRWIKYN